MYFIFYQSQPSQDPTIVKRVLDYVGPLQWLYIAGINRFWRGLYHCRDLTSTNPLEALTSLSRLYYSIRAGGLNVMMVQLQVLYVIGVVVVLVEFWGLLPISQSIFFFCSKDKRREKRTLEWWAGAVSASQDVMKCVQELRGSNGADLCCGTAFSGKLHVFQEVVWLYLQLMPVVICIYLDTDIYHIIYIKVLLRNLPDVLKPPHCHSILLSAARAPTPDVLQWLCEYMDKYPLSDDWWNDNHGYLMDVRKDDTSPTLILTLTLTSSISIYPDTFAAVSH